MIDKKPAVGRILLLDTLYMTGTFMKGGPITKVSGSTVWYTDHRGDTRYVRKYSAVCDTVEEESKLLDFSKRARVEYSDLIRRHEEEAESFLAK